MKACFRKAVEIADVVVMQMSQDDIFNRIRIDAERGKRLPRLRKNLRLRVSDTSALKPVSTTNVRPPPLAAHTK